MNAVIRRFFQSIPGLRDVYRIARRRYHSRRFRAAGDEYFINAEEYRSALETEDGSLVDLATKDGLIFTIRRNHMDAAILAEIFLDNCYIHGITLPDDPIVMDIGGYIGDFALYAVKKLNARKVLVCEPSPSNWVLLKRNISNNHCESRIEAVNKAVTDGQDVMMNIDVPNRGQAMVSAYGPSSMEMKAIPGVTLESLVQTHGLDVIDLLKMDCEGGEYTILSATPAEVYKRIRNIVFEYHEIDGFKEKLKSIKHRLSTEGYSLRTRGSLIYATRS